MSSRSLGIVIATLITLWGLAGVLPSVPVTADGVPGIHGVGTAYASTDGDPDRYDSPDPSEPADPAPVTQPAPTTDPLVKTITTVVSLLFWSVGGI
jgi:hypothetical protein